MTKFDGLFVDHFLGDKAEKIGKAKAVWIDKTIAAWIPAWRIKLLKRYPSKLLSKILIGEIEIVEEQLIADFGTRTWIKLNGLVIGSMNWNIDSDSITGRFTTRLGGY